MTNSPTTPTKKNALVSLMLSTTILLFNDPLAFAAPAVSGTNGCILKSGGAVVVDHGNKEGSNLQYAKCDPKAYNSFYDARELSFGHFTTADEVNAAFNQIHNEYRAYVDQRTDNGGDKAKYAEQDSRLAGHDGAISAVTSKNTEQDSRLGGHERIISALKESTVRYDMDAEGKETGSVTLADGTGSPVTIGNVAAGKSPTDAANAAQVSDTLRGLGGGAKLNDDGTVIGPKYPIGGKVESKVGDALTNLDGRTTVLEGDVSNLVNGTVGLVQQKDGSLGEGEIIIGRDTGGSTINAGGTKGNRVITGLRAGKNLNDAVNVSQFDGTFAALGGGARMTVDGTIQAPHYEVAGLGYDNVGDALKATNETAVQYKTDAEGKRTNEIVLTGDGTGPVWIRNVASGTSDSDAATMRQVKDVAREARTYTDQRMVELQKQSSTQFSALSNQIDRNLRETRGGIASAMGMAALRFDNNPGKLSIASGIGSFKGATSVVAGLGYTSLGGLVRVNASVGYNFGEDDLSVNAGASFTLN